MSQTLFHFQIEFLGYWHAGTGQAGAGDVDAVILRDGRGLPYFPGKALKGIFSEACCALVARKAMSKEDLLALFGREGGDSLRSGAQLRFANAVLPEAEANALAPPSASAHGFQDGLIEVLASTALEESGLAKKRTLRRIEAAIPMTLEFSIGFTPGRGETAVQPERAEAWLREAASLIKMAGAHRHAGLGECRIRFVGREEGDAFTSDSAPEIEADGSDLLRLPFELELLEDVVLGENPATAGAHRCLDRLTGAALLGAFASSHYSRVAALGGDAAFLTFHAGAVRFGDAYPANSGAAALPLPLAWHHKKNESLFDDASNALDAAKLVDLAIQDREKGVQYEQARGQWLGRDARQISVRHRRLLKSARDTLNFGRPAESQLFSYQALAAGQRFAGEIHVRADLVPADVISMLRHWIASCPRIMLGRSRSAEFGSCRLRPTSSFPTIPPDVGAESGLVRLYALSDLCFDGAEALPIDGAAWHDCLANWQVDLERTHARFRSFAYWNGYRACPEPERKVITHGSVIVLRKGEGGEELPADFQRQLDKDGVGIGLHQGLGRVLVNPAFPTAAAPESDSVMTTAADSTPACDSLLVRAARRRAMLRRADLAVDALAKEWASAWKGYSPQPSPSQWSRIRQLAAGSATISVFANRLTSMLDHGAARKAWKDAKRGQRSLADVLTGLSRDPSERPPQVTQMQKVAGEEAAGRLLLDAIAETARQMRQKSPR